MKLLYCRKCEENDDFDLDLKVFVPSVKNGFAIQGEKAFSLKSLLARISFWTLTFGKAKIYYLTDEHGEVIYTSYIIPACFKFPFMKSGDLEIGPCYTSPQFRGQGIYTKVLKSIVGLGGKNTLYYMIVDENNIASVKGIERAGFSKCGEVMKSKFFKRYCRKM